MTQYPKGTRWQNSREVVERVYISGRLVLETPAHFGNTQRAGSGDVGALTDMPLLYDSLDGKRPLLTGSSIAGALRHYLREYEVGYGVAEKKNGALLAERLFGHIYENEDKNEAASVESWLMVDDALGQFPEGASIEMREGVVIDGKTRTAEVDKKGKGKKFDIELLAAGTTFTLNFELWLTESNRELLEALALALKGLEEGKIGLGMRKRRGYGRCKVTAWQVSRYKMDDVEGLLGWLAGDSHFSRDCHLSEYKADIMTQLEVSSIRQHQGEAFRLIGTFRLHNSLLIRSYSGDGNAPDMVHLNHGARAKKHQSSLAPV
jgi:CRISPR/Cas system CSM-associated protein Csm3 (group 7 of RAMP superfamily)